MKIHMVYRTLDYKESEGVDEALTRRFGRGRVSINLENFVTEIDPKKRAQKNAEKTDCFIFIMGKSWKTLQTEVESSAMLQEELNSMTLLLEAASVAKKPIIPVCIGIDIIKAGEVLHSIGLGWLNNLEFFDLEGNERTVDFVSIFSKYLNQKNQGDESSNQEDKNTAKQKENPSGNLDAILITAVKQFVFDFFSPFQTAKNSLDPSQNTQANFAKTLVAAAVSALAQIKLDGLAFLLTTLVFLFPVLLFYSTFYIVFSFREKRLQEATLSSYVFYLLPEILKFALTWEIFVNVIQIYEKRFLPESANSTEFITSAPDLVNFALMMALACIVIVYFVFLRNNVKSFLVVATFTLNKFAFNLITTYFYLLYIAILILYLSVDPRTLAAMKLFESDL